jgi:hypothetical protein
MKMEQAECSKMSAYKIQMLGNYPNESIQHSQHVESLKSRIYGLNEDSQKKEKKKKDDTEISRIPETDKRQNFMSLLKQTTSTKYSEHQLKISLFHCWYVLLTR